MMPWMLSTVLLLLALQGSTSADRQKEELPKVNNPSLLSRIYDYVVGSPHIAPTSSSVVDDTGGTASTCSLIFDSIGPFCQYVVSIEPDSRICQPGFSMETCNDCQLIMQLCGSPDDKDLESICLSDMIPSCADHPTGEIDPFIREYCFTVESVCNGESLSGESASGGVSGSGSAGSGFSGSGSGSGVEPTVIPTTGSPGPSTTEPITTIPTTGTFPTTTIPTSTITSTTTTIAVDTSGTSMSTTATIPPFTTPVVNFFWPSGKFLNDFLCAANCICEAGGSYGAAEKKHSHHWIHRIECKQAS